MPYYWAFSILAPFEMRDSNGTIHQMLLLRNPWGVTYYNWTWNANDTNWTNDLVAQIPLTVDPRNSASEGIFAMPIEGLTTQDCMNVYSIGHLRSSQGYNNTWYDSLNQDDKLHKFYFRPSTRDGDLYIMAETYSYGIIPKSCTQFQYWFTKVDFYPIHSLRVYQNDRPIYHKYYADVGVESIIVPEASYNASDLF